MSFYINLSIRYDINIMQRYDFLKWVLKLNYHVYIHHKY